MELTTTEKKIIALLKKGQQQAEIAEYFRNNESFNINSQSAVEKLIMGLKKRYFFFMPEPPQVQNQRPKVL